uniref:Efflux RND transporter periplasmic adaptor subunit n=1 Tax=Rodentolepis nana TaxID=102285 RepID=A0A0R3T7S5_RODNA
LVKRSITAFIEQRQNIVISAIKAVEIGPSALFAPTNWPIRIDVETQNPRGKVQKSIDSTLLRIV